MSAVASTASVPEAAGPAATGPAASASVRVRLATAADVPQVMEIVNRVVPAMNAEGNYQWVLDDYPNAGVFLNDVDSAQLWVAEDVSTGELAGMAAISTAPEPEYMRCTGWADASAPTVVVHRLAAHPSFRGRGVAAALFRQAESVAAARGVRFVRVDTNARNSATTALFPRLGFRFTGEINLDRRPGQRFLCFEKEVRGGGAGGDAP